MQLLKDKRTACAMFCIIFLIYYLLSPVNHYLAEAISEGVWYRFSAPLLLGVILCMQIRKGKAFWVLLAYWCWVLLTRVLNGDPALTGNLSVLTKLSLMLLLFAPGFLLDKEQRWRFFLIVSWLIVLFYFVLGAMTVYSAAADQFLLNPIDEYAFCFLIILSFQYKSVPARVFFVLAGLVDAIVIALTISRNGQTFFSAALGMTAGFMLFQHLKTKRLSVRILTFFLSTLVVALIAYQVFEPLRYGVWLLRKETASVTQVQAEKEPVPRQQTLKASESVHDVTEEYHGDNREYLESGRKQIFWSALKSLEKEPIRLLIGCSYEHKMDVSHELIQEWAHHFHNMFLEIINLFGIPGLLLVLWFYWILMKAIWRIVFLEGVSDCPKQLLFIPILVISGYYMLEAGIFTDMDFRVAFFFFGCGMMAGAAQIPEREKTA